MRAKFYFLCLAFACLALNIIEAKTVLRRTDKISENFKQLDLPEEEIDPNVAPPEPQKVESVDTEDVSAGSGADTADENEVDDATAAASETVDEAANEVDGVAPAASEPAGAAASAASAAPSAAAVATTSKPPAATTPVKNEDDPSTISKYCKCTDSHCDCCRDFGVPILPVRAPACAKLTYLGNEKMSVSIRYGDVTLATRTISGKNAKPICVGLPGGYSRFCGRIYGLSKAKENFKACLGFELRAEDEVEAALRVSCFKFGPEGLRVAEAEPLPSEVNKEEDDDDDDIFGFAAGEDEEDTDDYDADEADEPEEADEDYEDDDETEAPAEADYGGFSLAGLLSELADDDEETTPAKPAVTPPIVAASATRNVKRRENVQGKDDKETVAAVGDESAVALPAVAEETAAAVVTPETTTVKSKKSKKSKKNKKKKNAAPDSESTFAFELINGILDFFN